MSDGIDAVDAPGEIFDAMFSANLSTIARSSILRNNFCLSFWPSNGSGSTESCSNFAHPFTRNRCVFVSRPTVL